MRKTLYNIFRAQIPSKHFIFFEGGACAMTQWHSGQSKP